MNKGFTLIELVLTIVLCSMGIMALFQAFNAAMLSQHQAQQHMLAVQLAQEKMEEIKNADTYAAIDGFVAPRANMGGAFASFDRAVTVSGDPKEVTVTLYWGPPDHEEQLQLVTLMSDYNY